MASAIFASKTRHTSCLVVLVALVTMGKAKKTRKFAATKRLLNATKDTRLQTVKSKVEKKTHEKKKEANGELVREM